MNAPVRCLTDVKGLYVIVKLLIEVKRGHTEAKGTTELKGPMEAKEPTTVKGLTQGILCFSATLMS